jgi:hypothetical protein
MVLQAHEPVDLLVTEAASSARWNYGAAIQLPHGVKYSTVGARFARLVQQLHTFVR